MALKVSFVVDGFNLYHSIVDIHRATGKNYRWLDIRKLCESFHSAIAQEVGSPVQTDGVFYFSALAHHRERQNPGTVARHATYIKALESTGVVKQLAEFKRKEFDYRCKACQNRLRIVRHEEKETDVAVAAKIIELAVTTGADIIVVLSGDTDLIPAIRTARSLAPDKPVFMLFPAGRALDRFRGVSVGEFKVKTKHYAAHQLPNPVVAPDGTTIAKPGEWT